MYFASNAFKKAIQDNTRSYYWTGKITTKNGIEYSFENEDIVKGSGYITNQCCGSTEIEIGTVYAAELGITLYSNVDDFTLEGGTIEVFFHLDVGVEYEIIPIGIFEISEANRTVNCLEIKAYDYMLRFEKDFSSKVTSGTPYDLLAFACVECHVELAHTQEEIDGMSNGEYLLSIYSENDIETCRDLIFYVAQVLGTFTTINREGKLELRKYGNVPVENIPNTQRFSSSFSYFVTRYTAISSTNMKTQASEYYALDTDDGLTMNLGTNPLLQYIVASLRKTILENLLIEVSKINYVPFDSTTIGNPAFDLGDIITFSGGQADSSKNTCITAYTYHINGKEQIKCVGKNPLLSQAKSKNDKNIAELISQIEAGKIVSQTYVNSSKYSVSSSLQEIISIDLVSNEDTSAQFHASIIVNVGVDEVSKIGVASGVVMGETVSFSLALAEEGKAEAVIVYKMNDNIIETFQPKETWVKGNHTLSLFYPLDELEANTVNEIRIYMRMVNGTADIDRGNVIASVYGQGLAISSEAEWDGYIRVEDKVSLFETGFVMLSVKEINCMGVMQIETHHRVSDTITLQQLGNQILKVTVGSINKEFQVEQINEFQDTLKNIEVGFSILSVSEEIMNEETLQE